MRGSTRAVYAGSLCGQVEGLGYWRLAPTGRRPAAHDIDGAPDRDHTDTVTRRRKVRSARPASGLRIEYLDLAVCPVRSLPAYYHQSTADSGRANAAASCRRVGLL